MESVPLVFFRGEFVPATEAKVSVMTHALHYGTAVFEGIRGNWNEDEGVIFIFRPREHYERLLRGARILRMRVPYSADELVRITVELLERSPYREDVYIRPIVFKSSERVANLKLHELDEDLAIIVVPFGAYLESPNLRVCVASWRRVDDTMIPPRVKIAGLYVNSILAKTDAALAGYDEAIMLNQDGSVCEGTGENLFLVVDGKLHTPPLTDNLLPGITRDCVITLARQELGLEVVERTIDRSELYLADEVFLTGTAAHLMPVVEIDHRPVGDGKPGPITRRLQALYFDVIRGRNPRYRHWCVPAVPARLVTA